jgi:hypothetical protein
MTCEDELTMMPMKLTMENAKGTARSCGRPAAVGHLARDAKSDASLRHDAHGRDASSRRGGGSVCDERCHVADAGHKAGHHRPGEIASVRRGGLRLADDGADASGPHDAPDKECHSGDGREDDGFEG